MRRYSVNTRLFGYLEQMSSAENAFRFLSSFLSNHALPLQILSELTRAMGISQWYIKVSYTTTFKNNKTK
jgi:hypothetical protein